MKEELETLMKENYELNRKLSMIEAKCKEAVKFQWKTMYFAKGILHILGVEIDV